MPDIKEFEDWYTEAKDKHDVWVEKAKTDWKFYNGDQWEDNTKSTLTAQKRPCLTLNYIRKYVRLLVGYEMRTRYNLKVYPIGERGDDDVSKLLSRLVKYIENQNMLDFQISPTFKYGLITGRGWIKSNVNYDENVFGDVKLRNRDSYEVLVDPYGRELDLTDHKYQIIDYHLEKDELINLYPKAEKEIEYLPMGGVNSTTGHAYFEDANESKGSITTRKTYWIRECWYRRYKTENYLINLSNGETYSIKDEELEDAGALEAAGTHLIIKRKKPEMWFAVYNQNYKFEHKKSPYLHKFYPNIPFFCEFIPNFDDIDADWVGIVRDALDPQREINKRRSEWLDILMRVVNTGWLVEEGAVTDKDKLKQSSLQPDVVIETAPGALERNAVQQKLSGQVNPALFQAGSASIQDLSEILNIPPSLLGFAQGSRESGKAIMMRKQQGNIAIAPYQDNLRITRLTIGRVILSMIPQLFKATRIARIISEDGRLETMSPNDLDAIKRVLGDISVGKYDVEISETPSTPTQRVAEFVELKEIVELMIQLGLPPNMKLLESLVMASDVSLKKEVIASLQQQAQQMPVQ